MKITTTTHLGQDQLHEYADAVLVKKFGTVSYSGSKKMSLNKLHDKLSEKAEKEYPNANAVIAINSNANEQHNYMGDRASGTAVEIAYGRDL